MKKGDKMKMSKKTLKSILATLLAVALIACLGVSAFAAESEKPGTETQNELGAGPQNGHDHHSGHHDDYYDYDYDYDFDFDDWFGGYGCCDGFGFDDFYGFDFGDFSIFDMIDIDEILEGIEDEELKAEIQKLYDEYIEATEKADSAWAALEEALEKNDLVPSYDDDDMEEPPVKPEAEDGKEASEKPEKSEKPAMSERPEKSENSEDMDELYEEFLEWYKNKTSET